MNAWDLKKIADKANRKNVNFSVKHLKDVILKSANEGNYCCDFKIIDFFIEDPELIFFLNSLNGFSVVRNKLENHTQITISWK